MKLFRVLAIIILLTAAPLAVRAQRAPANVPTRLTRQADFGIPFQLNQKSPSPTEVRLYVATPEAREWRVYQTQSPTAKGFQFRAPADGEYWFAVRTVDAQGKLVAHQQWRAEMKVIVDTQPPQLRLQASASADGEVRVRWTADDPNLLPHSFRLMYQSAQGTWQPVSVRTPEADDWRQSWESESQWRADRTTESLAIRAEIRDRAGNVTRQAETVRLQRTSPGGFARAEPAPTRGIPDRFSAPPPALSSPGATANSWRSATQTTNSSVSSLFRDVEHSDAYGAAYGTPTPPIGALGGDSPASPSASRPAWDREGMDRFGASDHPQRFANTPNSFARETVPGDRFASSPNSFTRETVPGDRFASSPNSLTRETVPGDRFAPISSQIEPPVARHVDHSPSQQQPDPRTRFLTSPHLALDYELYDVGPQGVRAVELWITRGQDQDWVLYGADADRQSPFEVKVDEEGLYGFRILVHTGNATAPPRPQRGDDADMWVGIDWNRPLARIRRAHFDSQDARSVTIEWQAEDALLAHLPISLRYGPSAEGPWTTIEAALPNSGVYQWYPRTQLPTQVYIELAVRDMAGNTSTDITNGPVSRGEPRGLIRDIRPVQVPQARLPSWPR